MKLYEFEGKEILEKYDIPIPKNVVLASRSDVPFVSCVVKAQVLFGKRADFGGVVVCKDKNETQEAINKLLGAKFKGEEVKRILVEELVEFSKQCYVSFLFDTQGRSAVMLFGTSGGTGVEEQKDIKNLIIDVEKGLEENQLIKFLKSSGANENISKIILQLWKVFVLEDCRLLEINPLVETKNGFVCIDAKIELDDFASFRHKERSYPERPSNLGRVLTQREKLVKVSNDSDYHGTVKYIEMDGDIAFLAAGGGASLTCMDALIDEGGKPANYTEFSGDPTEEKMYVLTKQAITKPGIKGCWIVGGIANFSRIDTMMAGIVKAFLEVNPKFPIVVRRSGPYEKEGFAILLDAAKKSNWGIQTYGAETPLVETAKIIVKKAYGNTIR